ncbi:RBR-type E3 ubiquitin transferase [Aphelenchoides besseyi]|nr:RBR-type E3 ubiquitin transferase [Aphelenchoides besseyi]
MDKPPTEYQILSDDQLYAEIDLLARQTSTLIGFHSSICEVLLCKLKWNSEELVNVFHNQNSKKAFLKRQKISPSFLFKRNQKLCQICFSKPLDSYCVHLENCGHVLCEECLEHYIRDQTNERNHLIQCRGPDECDLLNEKLIFRAVGNDEKLIGTYRTSLVSDYVQIIASLRNRKMLKDCPGVDCLYRWKLLTSTNFNVVCCCGGTFCFDCSDEVHLPASCSMMSRWTNFKRDHFDNANRLWISTNSKPCPRCQVNIEKNVGCDHVYCWKCQFEFCWLCLNHISHSNWYVHNCIIKARQNFVISAEDKAIIDQ